MFSRVWGDKGTEGFLDASIENTAKTSILDRLYAEKHVNYGVFDGKHCKNTVKKMCLKNFLYIYIYI